ncbi:MAG: NINE protein [Planctomycetota bacterium]
MAVAHGSDKGAAWICWILCVVGLFGLHRFYTGRWFTGLIWLFTGGLLFVGQIIDLFFVSSMAGKPRW